MGVVDKSFLAAYNGSYVISPYGSFNIQPKRVRYFHPEIHASRPTPLFLPLLSLSGWSFSISAHPKQMTTNTKPLWENGYVGVVWLHQSYERNLIVMLFLYF